MDDTLFPDAPEQVSIERQIKCVQRELKLRRRVYPNRIETGRMSPAYAMEEIAVMRAVLATLEAVQQKER